MFCTKCGKEIKENSIFCIFCGTKIQNKNYVKDNATINTSLSKTQLSNQDVYVISSKNKKIGFLLIILPITVLFAVLIIYSIVSLINGQIIEGGESPTMVVNIINLILGFLGLICLLGIIIGIPLSIVFFNKKELVDNSIKYDEKSGLGNQSVAPNEIKGWNWGAAGLTWIWGMYHQVWLSLLMFVPFINIIMFIILGLRGNEWAWKAQKWESVEKFKDTQKKWKLWGLIFFVLSILSLVLGLFI